MTISSNKSVKFSFIDWFLPLFYILAQYSYGFSSIGLIILIIYTVISLFSSSRLLIHKPLLIFVLFISFIQILNIVNRQIFKFLVDALNESNFQERFFDGILTGIMCQNMDLSDTRCIRD